MTGQVFSDDDDGQILASLRKLLGDEDTFRLVEEYGGVRISIPSRVRSSGRIAQLLGLRVLELLVSEHRGVNLYVPIARRFRVVEMRKQGKSYSQIAARLCMTERTVYGFIAEEKRRARRQTLLRSLRDGGELASRKRMP